MTMPQIGPNIVKHNMYNVTPRTSKRLCIGTSNKGVHLIFIFLLLIKIQFQRRKKSITIHFALFDNYSFVYYVYLFAVGFSLFLWTIISFLRSVHQTRRYNLLEHSNILNCICIKMITVSVSFRQFYVKCEFLYYI